jgi:hypothetical protein
MHVINIHTSKFKVDSLFEFNIHSHENKSKYYNDDLEND